MGISDFEPPATPPAVLGVDSPGLNVQELSGLVLLPQDTVDPNGTEMKVEIRALDDGRTALLAYNSLATLIQGCGLAQPWAAVKPEDVDRLVVDAEIDMVLWDVSLPERLRRVA